MTREKVGQINFENRYRDGSMKLSRLFILICVVAGLSAWLATRAMAACEDQKERVHENRGRFEELEGEKRGLREEIHQTPGTAQKHEIEARIEDIEREQIGLNEELRTLEHELSECQQQDRNGNDGLHPGIIAAIIGAIGAVLAALIGLLRRR